MKWYAKYIFTFDKSHSQQGSQQPFEYKQISDEVDISRS